MNKNIELPKYKLKCNFLSFNEGQVFESILLDNSDILKNHRENKNVNDKIYIPVCYWIPTIHIEDIKKCSDIFELFPEDTKEEKAKKELAKIDNLLSIFDNLL